MCQAWFRHALSPWQARTGGPCVLPLLMRQGEPTGAQLIDTFPSLMGSIITPFTCTEKGPSQQKKDVPVAQAPYVPTLRAISLCGRELTRYRCLKDNNMPGRSTCCKNKTTHTPQP